MGQQYVVLRELRDSLLSVDNDVWRSLWKHVEQYFML